MVLIRTFKCLTAVVLKKTDFGGKCNGSTAAAVWHRLTAEEAGLVAADVLAI